MCIGMVKALFLFFHKEHCWIILELLGFISSSGHILHSTCVKFCKSMFAEKSISALLYTYESTNEFNIECTAFGQV